jgi:hypothetical protein
MNVLINVNYDDERFSAVNSYPLTAWEDFLQGGVAKHA